MHHYLCPMTLGNKVHHLGIEFHIDTILLQCQYAVWYIIAMCTEYWNGTKLCTDLVLVWYSTDWYGKPCRARPKLRFCPRVAKDP